MANSVSQITVAPTANDSNADIEYLDGGDATLTDADTNTAAFDFDLDVGPNVVKVKVTAEDGTTTETYTVRIRRAEADLLVSNLGQYSNAGICISTPNTGLATQFTTGSESDGYRITQVRLNIDAESGTIPRVSIYSDNSGQPGSSLKILTNPGTVTTTRTEHDFGADNYKLDPSTSYWIVIERASGSGTMCVLFTRTYTAEDTGTAVGWSIGDNGSSLSSGGTWSTSTRIHLIAVRGTVAPAVSTDATLSALALKDASNNAVALSPTFASATTLYNATVANSVSQIKVEPTANDSNADIEYLDDRDATLPDEDTSTAVFDFDLNVGSNVVKVKVTAEDSSTTETYTITVTRQAAAAAASTDATLSALALFDFNSDGVTLSPAFAAAVPSYTAAVANAHTGGELEATPNDSNATVEFLDENDATITTVTQTGNVHSILPNFEVGENVFKVKVTAGDGTTTRTYTVTVTRQAAVPNRAPTGQPTISGTPQVDQTLTASTSGIDDADGLTDRVFSYQWVRVDGVDEADITGATSQTYLLTNDDQDLKIKVVVSFMDDRGEEESVSSTAFPGSGKIEPKSNNPPTGSPTITGQAEVGHTLIASTSGIADIDGLNAPGFTYQWQRQDGGVFTDIAGATGMLYTLTSDDEGKRVRVEVTFTDDDGNRHSLTSASTGTVQAQTSIPSDKVEVSLGATAYTVDEGDTLQVTVTLAEAPDDDTST